MPKEEKPARWRLPCSRPKRSSPRKRTPSPPRHVTPPLPRRAKQREKRSPSPSAEPSAMYGTSGSIGPASDRSSTEGGLSLIPSDSRLFSMAGVKQIASAVGQLLGPCPPAGCAIACNCPLSRSAVCLCDQVFCRPMLEIKRKACNMFTPSQLQVLATVMDVSLTLIIVGVVALVIYLLFFSNKSR